jgi:leucine-rich repeat (LRR) protein-like protein
LGYTFLGWYEGEKLLGTELSYTFSMPAKDVTYTAKWVENEEMAPFDFTSTPTTCVVTGVKDKTARSFVVPVYVTEIGEGAFSGCGSLESVTLPFTGGNAGAVSASRSTLFGYIFGSASYEGGRQTSQVFGVNDTDVYTCYVPDSLRSVKITGGEILYGAFSGCTLLTEVIVPETIKTVADYAFYYCSNLKQFTIPVTVESIGDHAFYYCYDLKSITIPDRITRIGNYAFCYCSGLERVTLGKGIIGIEGSAFSACTRLTTINIPERVTSIGDYAINSERDFRKTQQKISNNIENSLQMIA